MSEASPVDLRINYLWLMLLRTGVATSTNGRHSGCSALGPTREGSIKIHPERSIGAGHPSPWAEWVNRDWKDRNHSQTHGFIFALSVPAPKLGHAIDMPEWCPDHINQRYPIPSHPSHPLKNSTTLLYPSGTRFFIHILGVTFTGPKQLFSFSAHAWRILLRESVKTKTGKKQSGWPLGSTPPPPPPKQSGKCEKFSTSCHIWGYFAIL